MQVSLVSLLISLFAYIWSRDNEAVKGIEKQGSEMLMRIDDFAANSASEKLWGTKNAVLKQRKTFKVRRHINRMILGSLLDKTLI